MFTPAGSRLPVQRHLFESRVTGNLIKAFGFRTVSSATDGIPSIARALQIIRSENDAAKTAIGSEEYNFMPTANRELRAIEVTHRANCIEPFTEMLLDPTFEGPGARLLIGGITRLMPTRQSYFEHSLDTRFPTWQSFLTSSSPQNSYPLEFNIAGEEARTIGFEYPTKLMRCIEKNLQSKYPDVVVATLQSCAKIGDNRLSKICREHITSEDKAIRNTAITSCARLSALDTKMQEFFRHFLYSKAPIDEKNIAFEAFMNVFSSEENRKIISGIIEDSNLSDLVQSHGFLNNMLDLPREDLNKLREQLVTKFDISELPDSSLMRIVRLNVLDHKIRTAANKVLKTRHDNSEFLNQEKLTVSRYGLLAHRASKYWVGHTCIFISEDQIIDMTTGRGHDAVKQISFQRWKDGRECWGIREERKNDGHYVNLDRAVAVAKEIASWKTEYDTFHLHQKGKWNKPWSCRPKYWEADCVGFTEHCYEMAGGDPIPNREESWPILPTQQRDHMTKVLNC